MLLSIILFVTKCSIVPKALAPLKVMNDCYLKAVAQKLKVIQVRAQPGHSLRESRRSTNGQN